MWAVYWRVGLFWITLWTGIYMTFYPSTVCFLVMAALGSLGWGLECTIEDVSWVSDGYCDVSEYQNDLDCTQ